MAIDHKNIPEDGLHEPKGASTASASRVYVANGSGSGDWSRLSGASLQGSLTNNDPQGRRLVTDGNGGFSSELTPASAYGTINLTNNTTVKAVTTATDTTLNTFADYVKLDIALNTSNVVNMSSGSSSLIVEEPGLYLIDFWASVKSNTNATKFGLIFVTNNTTPVAREVKHTLSTNGVIYNMSANGIHDFSNGANVSIYIAADKDANITIEDMTFRMVYLGALV